jgi:hypothetical protein
VVAVLMMFAADAQDGPKSPATTTQDVLAEKHKKHKKMVSAGRYQQHAVAVK